MTYIKNYYKSTARIALIATVVFAASVNFGPFAFFSLFPKEVSASGAQTLYFRSTNSAVVSGNANVSLLSTTAGSSTNNSTYIANGSHAYTWQFVPGTSNSTTYSIPSTPDSVGWIFDASSPGTYAGTAWMLNFGIKDSNASGVAVVKAQVFLVTANTTAVTSVTNLSGIISSAGFTPSTGYQTKSITFTPTAFSVSAGQYIYVEAYLTMTTAGSKSTGKMYFAEDDTTSGQGDIVTSSFSASPTITSPTVTSISTSTATLGADVTSAGDSTLTDIGTCWGTTANPTTNCLDTGSTSVGTFTQPRTGFSPNTLYHYVAYASSSAGESYTTDATFTTSSLPPDFSVTSTDMVFSTTTPNLDDIISATTTIHNIGASWVSATSTEGEYYDSTNGASDDANYSVYASQWLAQAITPAVTTSVSQISLYMYCGMLGNYTNGNCNGGALTVLLETDNAGLPSGTAVATTTVPNNTVPDNANAPAWFNISFPTYPTLNAGTKYWIVLEGIRLHSDIGYGWAADNTSPTYPGGNMAYSTNSGSAWTTLAYDAWFRVYGGANTPIMVNYYDGDPASGGTQIGATQVIYSLASGSSTTTSITWDAGAAGTHDIYVLIDPNNQITEADKTNNKAYTAVTVNSVTLAAPTSLYVGYPSAQSCCTNPTNVTTSTPMFSAVNNHGQSVTTVQVQVTTSSDTGYASPVWDSGDLTGMTATANGARTPDIPFGVGNAPTSLLQGGQSYIWRIRTKVGYYSSWSANGTIDMASSGSFISRFYESKDTYWSDSYAAEGAPNSSVIGYGGWGDHYYLYIQWANIDTLGPSATDTTLADVWLDNTSGKPSYNPTEYLEILTGSWDQANTYVTYPDTVTTANDVLISGTGWPPAGYATTTITTIYKDWKNGTYTNYGLEGIPTTITNSSAGDYNDSRNTWYSTAPYLEVTYNVTATLPPTVTLPTATSVSTSTATFGADITSAGSSAITTEGTCWGLSANPTTNCLATGSTSTGVFTQARTGLSPNTLYHYVGYAVNSYGTSTTADATTTTLNLPASNVYYSVGQSTSANLMSGTPTLTISGGAGVFSAAQNGNIGVGDAVTYGSGSVAYISAKTNSDDKHWSLVTATGAAPPDVSGASVTSINRAYASLNAAVNGATDSSHLNTTDLVAGDYILNIPCYNDSSSTSSKDTTEADIPALTTSATNDINIYTPTSTVTQANADQRHNGEWSDGAYNMQVSSGNGIVVNPATRYVNIDGLQVSVTDSNAANYGIEYNIGSGSAVYDISNNIIRGILSGSAASSAGITASSSPGAATFNIWNNMVYGWNTSGSSAIAMGGSAPAYVYNNTLYGNYTGFSNSDASSTIQNVIANGDSYADYSGTFTSSSTDNISQDATSPNSLLRNETVAFVATSTQNFHLSSSDTSARGNGVNLTYDPYLQPVTDIDGDSRPTSTAWDIGADEYKSSGYPVSGTVTSAVFDTGTVGAAYNSIYWTGTLGGQTQNLGKVRFQFGTSNTPSVTTYYGDGGGGASSCNTSNWYDSGTPPTGGPNKYVPLTCAPKYNNNQRYFSYKIEICSDDCVTAGTYTPSVTSTIVNWSP